MLPKGMWREYEPRFAFPTFKGVRSSVSLVIPGDFNPRSYAKYKSVGKSLLRQKMPSIGAFLQEQFSLWLTPRPERVHFRLVIVGRDGCFLGQARIPGEAPPGGFTHADVDQHLRELDLPDDDYVAIIIMSHGRMDGFRSSPTSFSMTYVGEKQYSTYRTGAFARTLNDPRRKQHFGFRGINPKITADDAMTSGILLINHSSNPNYDQTSVLLRGDGASREANFGKIPPFGAVERSVTELFGEDVSAFLAPCGGMGTAITSVQGVTLASIHLMRDSSGELMSIEHSRPSHTYLGGIR